MAKTVFILKWYDVTFGVFETEELALIHAKLIDGIDDACVLESPFNDIEQSWRKNG